jgi:hypothetical protein
MIVTVIRDTFYTYPQWGKILNAITANCHTQSKILFIHLNPTDTQELSYIILNFK